MISCAEKTWQRFDFLWMTTKSFCLSLIGDAAEVRLSSKYDSWQWQWWWWCGWVCFWCCHRLKMWSQWEKGEEEEQQQQYRQERYGHWSVKVMTNTILTSNISLQSCWSIICTRYDAVKVQVQDICSGFVSDVVIEAMILQSCWSIICTRYAGRAAAAVILVDSCLAPLVAVGYLN